MSALPKGWAEASLRDIVTKIGSGATPRGGEASYKVSGVPLIRSLNVHFDGIRSQGMAFLDDEQAAKLDSVTVQENDILLNITGASIGRVALVPGQYDGARVNQHVSIIRPIDGISPSYVCNFLKSPFAQQVITNRNYGVTRQALTKAMVGDFMIPLPPLEEQQRIVEKLDFLHARVERALIELARVEVLLDQMKIFVLKSAFDGRLTADTRKGKKPRAEVISENSTPLWEIPPDWQWHRVDQIGHVALGRQRSPENHDGQNMRPYLRSANITWQGVDITDVKMMNFDANDFEKFQLHAGDVLLNEGSGSAKEVGKPAIWRGEVENCCFQNTVLRLKPKLCSSEFIYFYFLYTALSGKFISSAQGVNIQHIGRDGLARYPAPIPPQKEQSEIVVRLESAFKKIDGMAQDAKRARELISKIRESYLTKAFIGGLVMQNDEAEPADAMLKRILKNSDRASKIDSSSPPRKIRMTDTKDFLEQKLRKWPSEGCSFQELRGEFSGSYEDLKDLLFSYLSSDKPRLVQVFDQALSKMIIRKTI